MFIVGNIKLIFPKKGIVFIKKNNCKHWTTNNKPSNKRPLLLSVNPRGQVYYHRVY